MPRHPLRRLLPVRRDVFSFAASASAATFGGSVPFIAARSAARAACTSKSAWLAIIACVICCSVTLWFWRIAPTTASIAFSKSFCSSSTAFSRLRARGWRLALREPRALGAGKE